MGIIRATRPHVVLTYGDDQEGYPHPDHLQVHAISVPAFELAGDPSAHPDKGDPWQPSKLYYSSWSRARIQAMHDKFLELGLESPFDARWFDRPSQDHRLTTVIDVSGLYQVRKAALIAHATQVDPTSPFWFGIPDDVAETVYPHEDYILAESLVDTTLPETDLFAGVTKLDWTPVPRRRTVGGGSALGGELTQHVLQDAAVAVVLGFLRACRCAARRESVAAVGADREAAGRGAPRPGPPAR